MRAKQLNLQCDFNLRKRALLNSAGLRVAGATAVQSAAKLPVTTKPADGATAHPSRADATILVDGTDRELISAMLNHLNSCSRISLRIETSGEAHDLCLVVLYAPGTSVQPSTIYALDFITSKQPQQLMLVSSCCIQRLGMVHLA